MAKSMEALSARRGISDNCRVTSPGMHLPLAWLEESPEGLADEAVALVQVTLEPEADPDWISVDGVCPKCRGPLHHRQPVRTVLAREPESNGRNAEVYEAVVFCDCGIHHEGADPELTGCGRSFRLIVKSA
ncbi:hypothetical protein [Actinomadura formosensis]|uniref:hypothetical protein n=1 Tax=Actinomadura formosensis TaxID=60706 RepID=UPI003D90239F